MNRKRSKLNGLTLPDDLLAATLQFAIDSRKVWSSLQSVSQQFKRCARNSWALSHYKFELGSENQLMELQKADVGPQNLALAWPADLTLLLDFDVLRYLSLDRPTDMATVSKLSSLQTLDLHQADIGDQDLSALASLPRLSELHLTHIKRITDLGLQSLAPLRLTVLTLQDCPLLSSQGVSTLSHLERFVLYNCTFIDNDHLEVFKPMQMLTSLTLGPCNEVNQLGLKHISPLPLQELDLRGCTLNNSFFLGLSPLVTLRRLALRTGPGGNATSSALMALQPLVRLEALDWRFDLGDQALGFLSPLTALRSIRLSPRVTDVGIVRLSKLVGLTELTLSHMAEVTDRGVRSLSSLKMLEKLTIENVPITGAGLSVLSELPLLDTLSLNKCPYLTNSSLQGLGSLPSLRTLNVRNSPITDLEVESFPVLSRLDLSGCVQLSGAAVARLVSSAKKLTSLDVSGCLQVDDGSLVALSPNLTKLKLTGCIQVTNKSFAGPCVDLQTLDVSGCSDLTGECFQPSTFPNLEQLSLADCDGFVAFSLLAALTTLRDVNLSFCDFTDKAALAALSFIRHIDSSGCYGSTEDNAASGKVEQQQAEVLNKPTEELIQAMRTFVVPPYISQSFYISKRAAQVLLGTYTRRRILEISWADIDWRHISWHFGCLRPRWALFRMDDGSIQVHARPVWPSLNNV
jgi:Leucine-rich repeat (LRR) protein